jgi:LytS/YehU family sensor histidine kinase
LKFLKAQINPHFLFNTLNNIYSLAYRQDANAAPMIATLSKIMRYHLYEGSWERVSLKKEADMLQDYIALQRIKYGDELRVDFYIEGIGPQHEIAPLLLITFVENSFKHGDAESNKDAWVNVSLSVEDGVLHFSVENSFQKPKSQAEGLGLKNAARLLDLAYPGRSSLETKSDNGVFSVQLTIEL